MVDALPKEFISQFNRCFGLLSKCSIMFFKDDMSKPKKYWRLFYMLPFAFLFNLSMWAFMAEIDSKTEDVFEIAYMASVCLISLQAIAKAIILLCKRTNIENMILEIGSTWRTSDLTVAQQLKKKRLMKRLRWYQSIFYWTNIIGAWQHFLAPLMVILIQRFILEQDIQLKLPFGGVFPYDPKDSWYKYLSTYAFQTFTLLNEVYVYIGSEYLMITLCANLAIEFSMLREDLLHVSPTFGNDLISSNSTSEIPQDLVANRKISIKDFVRQHQKLIGFAKQLDDIFNEMMAEGAVETAHNSIGVFALLLPAYIFCNYGELLKDESLGIADSAYANPWYKGDVNYQNTIKFITARSQRACYMTALRHVPVTLSTFTKVLSTTWSYFSLLKSVYLKDE